MRYSFRLTGKQREELRQHLFTDQAENIAFLLCKVTERETQLIYTCRSIHIINEKYIIQRHRSFVKWQTEAILPLIDMTAKEKLAIFKIHSHLIEAFFSEVDDEADAELLSSILCRIESPVPNGSLIMYSDGRLIGRVMENTEEFKPIEKISVSGSKFDFYAHTLQENDNSEAHESQKQAFGPRTNSLLKALRIGVVGCSGIGSHVVEQLARLGAGHIVLVDPDKVEMRNLNRIIGTKAEDAKLSRFKVDVMAQNIADLQFGTVVEPLRLEVHQPSVIKKLSECDVLFGCVDSIDGRDILCRISRYYLIPYFDFGIKLQADGMGGVSQICGTVHFLEPESRNLMERGVYDAATLQSAYMKRLNPEMYADLLREQYLKGVSIYSPAVISVNMLTAARGVCDFLNRIHPYRDEEEGEVDTFRFSLTQERYFTDYYGHSSNLRNLGLGDTVPLLEMNLGHET